MSLEQKSFTPEFAKWLQETDLDEYSHVFQELGASSFKFLQYVEKEDLENPNFDLKKVEIRMIWNEIQKKQQELENQERQIEIRRQQHRENILFKNPPGPFFDRVKQLQFLLEFFIRNYEIANINKDDPSIISNRKFIFPITAQMFGTGKSTLGIQLQNQISRILNGSPKSQEESEFKGYLVENRTAVEFFLNANFVHFNMNIQFKFEDSLEESIAKMIFETLSKQLGIEPPELMKQLRFTTLKDRIDEIKKKFGFSSFFFHFDEISELESIQNGKTIEENYEMFWRTVFPLQIAHNFLYFSGKTPGLFFIGRKHSTQLTSPGLSRLIILTPFSEETVLEYYHQNTAHFRLQNASLEKFLAKSIHERTLGFPRLVSEAFNHLDRFSRANPISCMQDVELALGSSFVKYLESENNLDIKPFSAFKSIFTNPEAASKILASMIVLSILKVPISTEKIDTSQLEFQKIAKKEKFSKNTLEEISILDLVGMLGIFTTSKEITDPSEIRLCFPPVLIDQIIKSNEIAEFSAFNIWLKPQAFLSDLSDPFEKTLLAIVHMRVVSKIFPLFEKSRLKWKIVFPWTTGSFVEDMIAGFNTEIVSPKVPSTIFESQNVSNEKLEQANQKQVQLEALSHEKPREIHPDDVPIYVDQFFKHNRFSCTGHAIKAYSTSFSGSSFRRSSLFNSSRHRRE